MPTNIIHLTAVGSGGTENDIAQFDIPEDGRISGLSWEMSAQLDATEVLTAELGFISTNQVGTSDSRGGIDIILLRANQITAVGIVEAYTNKFVTFENLQVAAGERIHLHLVATAGVVSTIHCHIHLETSVTVRRARRRR